MISSGFFAAAFFFDALDFVFVGGVMSGGGAMTGVALKGGRKNVVMPAAACGEKGTPGPGVTNGNG